nr:unnamed protein product [Digitaria exilis]
MAGSSSSAPLLALPVTEKLARGNFVLWQAQVMPAIRGAQLESHLDIKAVVPAKEIAVQVGGKAVKQANPEFVSWVAKDQQVLSYLLTSMTREVMAQVATHKTAATLWAAVEVIFSSQTKARGNLTMAEYIAKMKTLTDDMATAGKQLEDDDVISHILTSLDSDYNPIITSILTRADPHNGHQGGSSANLANRDGRGRGNLQARDMAAAAGGDEATTAMLVLIVHEAETTSTPVCQICGRGNHTAMDCWYRFEEDYVPHEKIASAATNSYGVDANWYTDTGSTDHITADLNKLHVHNSYNGNDQISRPPMGQYSERIRLRCQRSCPAHLFRGQHLLLLLLCRHHVPHQGKQRQFSDSLATRRDSAAGASNSDARRTIFCAKVFWKTRREQGERSMDQSNTRDCC